MPTISYGSNDPRQIKAEWEGDVVSESLRIVLRSVLCRFDGGWITCLVRDDKKNEAEGGVSGSKHIPRNGRRDKCEAGDFVLFNVLTRSQVVIDYVRDKFEFVDIIWHKGHFHLEIDTGVEDLPVLIQF